MELVAPVLLLTRQTEALFNMLDYKISIFPGYQHQYAAAGNLA